MTPDDTGVTTLARLVESIRVVDVRSEMDEFKEKRSKRVEEGAEENVAGLVELTHLWHVERSANLI